jgi:hypothetical protein
VCVHDAPAQQKRSTDTLLFVRLYRQANGCLDMRRSCGPDAAVTCRMCSTSDTRAKCMRVSACRETVSLDSCNDKRGGAVAILHHQATGMIQPQSACAIGTERRAKNRIRYSSMPYSMRPLSSTKPLATIGAWTDRCEQNPNFPKWCPTNGHVHKGSIEWWFLSETVGITLTRSCAVKRQPF